MQPKLNLYLQLLFSNCIFICAHFYCISWKCDDTSRHNPYIYFMMSAISYSAFLGGPFSWLFCSLEMENNCNVLILRTLNFMCIISNSQITLTPKYYFFPQYIALKDRLSKKYSRVKMLSPFSIVNKALLKTRGEGEALNKGDKIWWYWAGNNFKFKTIITFLKHSPTTATLNETMNTCLPSLSWLQDNWFFKMPLNFIRIINHKLN